MAGPGVEVVAIKLESPSRQSFVGIAACQLASI